MQHRGPIVASSRSLQRYQAAWDELLSLSPGHMCGELYHYCDKCCAKAGAGGSPDSACVKRISKAVISTVLRAMPPVPEEGKWCKACPMLSFLLFGWCCFGLLPKLLDNVFRPAPKAKLRPPPRYGYWVWAFLGCPLA